jgi:flagellar hook-length control protein FliK
MTIMSSLSLKASSGPSPASSSAAQSGDPSTDGKFGALVDARARANEDRPVSAPPLSPSRKAQGLDQEEGTSKAAATPPATPAAATLAMVSALDRSAKMLWRPPVAGPPVNPSVDKKEKADRDAAAPMADAASPFTPQACALLGVSALPTIASATPGAQAGLAKVVTPPASNDRLGAVQLPIIGIKTGVDSDRDSAASRLHDSVDAVIPAGTEAGMLRELVSTGTTGVTASTQPSNTVVDRHLDLARGDAWLNDLASDIAATATNGGRLNFGLAPETLGRMNVEIHQSAAGVNIHMTTTTEAARDMLTAAQPRIVDEIRAQGVRVAGTQVSTDASGFGGDRTGSAPRQPTGLPIDVALSFGAVASPSSAEPVASGRYA